MYAGGFGIRPVPREMARALAGRGYFVLVPNFLCRHGPAPVVELLEHIGEEARTAVMGRLMPLIEAHTIERTLRDADAHLRFLTTQSEGRRRTSRGDRLLHRRPPGGAHRRGPPRAGDRRHRIPCRVGTAGPDSLRRLTAQVHFNHAETDLTPEVLGELNEGLDAAGVDYTSEICPAPVHGFTMADTDAFNPSALQLPCDHLLAFLGRTLATR